jgi:hypothetical protein
VNKWKLGFTTGAAQRPRERQVPAGDVHTVLEEIRWAKGRFGLPENTRVVSCYEAGRDGFWLYRSLARKIAKTHGAKRILSPFLSLSSPVFCFSCTAKLPRLAPRYFAFALAE